MKEKLKSKAAALPLLPGVYLMRDKEGSIIYVGKSKHLKKRVGSYFSGSKNRPRKVERMIKSINDFEYIVTDTELDALLLECDLIKEIKPIYNKLLKNDNNYRYIHLNMKGKFPYFESTYDRDEEDIYFGPYDMRRELDEAIDLINSYYGLAQCKNSPIPHQCIALLRKTCLAPCQEEAVTKEYKAQLQEAIRFLKNETSDILVNYETKMKEAAENLLFEEAEVFKRAYYLLKMLTYREEAIAWSLSDTKTIAFIEKPDGGMKVYFLFGSEIIKTLIIKKKRFLKKWWDEFKGLTNEKSHINKNEIDRAYIIYSYLRRSQYVADWESH